MPNAVYDEEEKLQKKPGNHDDLGASDADRASEVAALNDSFYRDEGPDLQAAEGSGDTGSKTSKADNSEVSKLESLYRDEQGGGVGKKAKALLSTRKGKLLVGGGVGGGLIGMIIFAMFLFPLKLMHIANNLQDNFFAASEQAGEDMGEHLLRSYIVHKVMPGMISGKCSSTKIDRSCAAVADGSGPISIMYRAWKDNNLEGKLATKHGIEIKRNGNKFTLITPATGSRGVDLGEFNEGNPNQTAERVSRTFERRSDIRREFRLAYESDTFSKRIMYRFKVGPLLERKYGIKRCLMACDTRDRFNDSIDNKKLAFKSLFVEKIIQPKNEMYGIAMRCALSAFACANPGETDENGEAKTQFENDLRESVNRYAASGKSLEELQSLVDDFNRKGFTGAILEKMLGEMAAKIAVKGVPVIGWIDLGATIFSAGSRAGPALATMNYSAMAATGVTAYQMFLRTPADEIKSGDIDATVLGSMTNALGPDAGSDQGGLGAEGSPYYTEIMNGGGTKTASLFDSRKVYAAGSGYSCNDGKPLPQGEVLCPEEKYNVAQGLSTGAGTVSAVINGPLGIFADTANLWVDSASALIDAIVSPFGEALAAVAGPLFDKFMSLIDPFIAAFTKWFSEYAFNQPITENMSGARWFNVMANGADEAGNSFAHYGMGASAVDYATAQSIRTARAQERLQEFQSQTLLARITDTESKHSLSSKFAMSLSGSSINTASQSLFSTIISPFTVFGDRMTTFVPSSKANAARSESPAGITQYAWDPNDPVFKTNPEEYIKNNDCENPDQVKNWNTTYSKLNPKTNMPELTKANGCLLLNTSIVMGGAYFTDELLTAEELGDAVDGETSVTSTKFKVATYNVKVPGQTDGAGDPRDQWLDSDKRYPIVADIVTSNQLDVVGFQEIEKSSYNAISNLLGNYDSFPGSDGRNLSYLTPIFWNNQKFAKVSAGYFGQSWRLCSGVSLCNDNPWVKLQEIETGAEFYVTSVHLVNRNPYDGPNKSDAGGAEKREATSKSINQWVNGLPDGAAVMVLGDMNSSWSLTKDDDALKGDRSRIPYCIFTKPGVLSNAFDLDKGRSGEYCPTKDAPYEIDHIYVSHSNVQISEFQEIANQKTKQASDHDPVYAEVTVGNLSSGAGTEFVIGTYNQPARGNASAAANRIKSSNMDIVGLQEQSGNNYGVIRGILKEAGYGVYPDVNVNGGGHCAKSRPIYYNKSKFSLSQSEVFDIPSYENNANGPVPAYRNPVDCGDGERTKGGGRANVPVVWLNDTRTKQTIIVMNTHNLSNCCGGGGEQAAKKRYEAAQIYIAKIKELNAENPGVPIFFTGDFNEGTGVRSDRGQNTTWQRDHNNLFYCMATKQEKVMIRAAGSRDQPCANNNEGIGGVDYIYASPGVKTEWVNQFTDPSTNDGPHDVVYAKLVVPGDAGAAAGIKGWSWPLKKDINNGPCYGGPRVHAGMDMNSSTSDNPVYAMHSGKVVRRGSGGAAGNYITILADAKFEGNPVYYSYEHLKDGSLKVNLGDEVKGGQEVAIAGTTGNVSLGSSKAHLHIVTATTNSLGSYGNLGTTFDPMKILRTVNPVPGGYKCTNS